MRGTFWNPLDKNCWPRLFCAAAYCGLVSRFGCLRCKVIILFLYDCGCRLCPIVLMQSKYVDVISVSHCTVAAVCERVTGDLVNMHLFVCCRWPVIDSCQ